MIHPKSHSMLPALAIGAALAAAGAILAGQNAQPRAHPAPAPDQSVPAAATDTALARLAAAERVCKILHDRQTGVPHGHEGVEHTYLWSQRRMEAEIAVERTKPGGGDGGIAAIERHAEWMRAWAKQVAEGYAKGAFSAIDLASTEFYIAEAEDLLARAK